MEGKNYILLTSLGFILSIFTSCKKGENDPLLSIHTRKARMIGEWKVSNSEEEYTLNGKIEYSSTYDGSVRKEMTIFGGDTTIDFNNLLIEFHFKRDGSFKIIETTKNPGFSEYISTTEGNWTFVGKNKNANLKNKEAIVLTNFKKINNVMPGDYSNTFQPFETLIIDELRNNKIVFFYNLTVINNNSGETHTIKGNMTLIPK